MYSPSKGSNDNYPLRNTGSKLIAVVDDEPDIVELVSLHLVKAGYKVQEFYDASSFLKFLKFDIPDLVILDIMLPDSDGLEICKFLKRDEKYSSMYVVMLTAKGEEMDKVIGLEIGADDYISKPFSPRELIARTKAILRRDTKQVKTNVIRIGESVEIDLHKYEIKVSGVKIELTSSEFKILKLLSERKGWVFSREQILQSLGAYDKGVLDRTVDVHIKNLREKLGPAGSIIKNIRGIGYKIEE
jgi:two-component system phosphate regulon response regulator PhoB/two-component system alkaline phosphatase synthesis response regulator PhoP